MYVCIYVNIYVCMYICKKTTTTTTKKTNKLPVAVTLLKKKYKLIYIIYTSIKIS